MNSKLRLVLRPFLAGVLLTLFTFPLVFSIYRNLSESLVVSLGTGLAFAGVLISANLIHLKKYGEPKCRHTRTLELHADYDRAFELCLSAVRSLGNVEIEEVSKGRIIAVKQSKVPLDWLYNRDRITVELHRIDDTKTGVRVSSELFPHPPSEHYVDYGSNLENVERIVRYLSTHA